MRTKLNNIGGKDRTRETDITVSSVHVTTP